MSFIKTFASKIGIDKAILYTVLGRGLSLGTAVFTVFFITKYLSAEEQGYYYTFGSIVAIQVFFELGLTSIITQFVAHEASHLSWDSSHNIQGEDFFKSRLSSLLHFCAKWYLVFAVLIIIALVVVGYFFFSKFGETDDLISWKVPWVLLVIGTAMNFLMAPISAFIEGLGRVKEIARIRLIQQIIYPVIIWGGLAIGSKLYVSGVNAIVAVVTFGILVFKSSSFSMLKSIWCISIKHGISYTREILPLQWRIAISWVSGYFIFQLFNPVLFATEGSTVAGQMGMTMSALNAIQALTLSWINTKVPILSGFIARKEYGSLDNLFNRTLYQMLAIGTTCVLFFTLIIIAIQKFSIMPFGINIGQRFLSPVPLFIMAISVFTTFPINCWATYLRCHKKEPLLYNSLIIGILCSSSILFFGNKYGLLGMCISYCSIRLISMFWVYLIYKCKKYEWHK